MRLILASHMPRRFFLLLMFVAACGLHAQKWDYSERENLSSMINTSFDEVYPIISPDGDILYFVRKDYPQNVGGPKADIWYCERLPDSSWGMARNIGAPLNTSGYNYVCHAFPDNNSLLLGNHYLPDGTQAPGISLSTRTNEGWTPPRNHRILAYSNKAKYAEFTVSPDMRVLLLSIEKPGGLGGRDICFSFRVDDSTWSEPVNPGAPLNSSSDDITPFLAADGKTLYFSSGRPGGFGSNDIYFSRREDPTWLSWSEPQNMGYPVNTPGWDAYYSVPASGEYAYFVSTMSGHGLSDIFRTRLQKHEKPMPVLMLTGIAKDFGDVPLPALIYYQRLSDTLRSGVAHAHPSTGVFTIALPAGEQWQFRAELEGYYPISENIDLRNLDEYRKEKRDLVLVPIEKGRTILLNNIFFDFDMAELRPESVSELQRLVNLLRSQPTMRVQINGHTDSVGTYSYNEELSQARAQAVVDYLIGQGIPPARLNAMGYGEALPVESNDSEYGRQKNRRVEFTIL